MVCMHLGTVSMEPNGRLRCWACGDTEKVNGPDPFDRKESGDES